MSGSSRYTVAALVASAQEATVTEISTEAELLTKLSELKRATALNASQRSQHKNSPHRFMQSELSLDGSIRALSSLAVHPSLYAAFIQNGGLESILTLLKHDNEDIVYRVVSLIHDLVSVDEDSTTSKLYSALYAAIVEKGVAAALTNVLYKRLLPSLADANEEDRDRPEQAAAAVYSVFENVLDLRPDLAQPLAKSSSILEVCVSQLRSSPVDSTAVELLAVLMQDSIENKLAFVEGGGVKVLLEALSSFRKKARTTDSAENMQSESSRNFADVDSRAEQEEMTENMFGLLCSALLAGEEAKGAFVRLEGVQLMVAFMKSSSEYRIAATKVVDFACTAYAPAVTELLQCGGLGVFCAVLESLGDGKQTKRGKKRKRSHSEEEVKTLTEHIFGVLFCVFRYGDDSGRKRLLFKFWENGGSKTRKVLLLYYHFAQSVENATAEKGKYLLREDGTRLQNAADDDDDDGLIDRLDAGLFIVQLGAAIIADILSESDEDFQKVVTSFLPELRLNCEILGDAVREYAHSIEAGDGNLARKQSETERQRLIALADQLTNLPVR